MAITSSAMPVPDPSSVAVRASMKRGVILTIVAPLLFLMACATPDWQTSRFEKFPINRGRVERGEALLKVIALVPGGGAVADAVGVELARRGFVIVSPASTVNMVTGVDLKAVSESYIPTRRSPVEMGKLRQQLLASGVDAFLVMKVDRFTPYQLGSHAYSQQVDYYFHSTQFASPLHGGEIAFGGWANIHKRPMNPAEAAVEIVNRMATRTGI